MTLPRKPAAFRLDEPARDRPVPTPAKSDPAIAARRAPRAVDIADAIVVPAAVDVFEEPDLNLAVPPPASAPTRRSIFGPILAAALGTLVTLAVGLWADRLIRTLFERAEWLGWLAAAAAAVAATALIIILAREALALARLASIEKLRAAAIDALGRDDSAAARNVVGDLSRLLSEKPETAAGRRVLDELRDEIIDGANLVRLAEAELLGPLDAKAKTLVLDAAKRVSVVTAVSPRALVDIAYVVFEATRLIRRLSDLYGGRPGVLGFLRLARSMLAHLAVTGAMAAGDDFVHQIVGQGLAARLSAKLGEGVVNGMMTARIGIAAMEAARPLPFAAVKRPGMSDFLSALTSFTSGRQSARGASGRSGDDGNATRSDHEK